MFCGALADWCLQWNFAINVNCHSESRHEFMMLLKLQYRPLRWVRLVEAMANSHFIEGVHTSLINKFSFTRAGPFERFLNWQSKNNPHAIFQYEDFQRAIVKLDAKGGKQRTGQRSQGYHDEKDDKDEEVEGSTKRMKVGRGTNK